MLERVTYILGAGFSAPLGLPVMRDFLAKSKDLYFSDTERFSHFRDVFSLIDRLSVIKNYYDADLLNIEEILSILEMEVFVDKKRLKKAFLDYVRDVIVNFTPEIPLRLGGLPGNWKDFVFGASRPYVAEFGHFAGNILGLEFDEDKDDAGNRKFHARVDDARDHAYSVISLNYDIVLESYASFVNNNFEVLTEVGFNRPDVGEDSGPILAKLHGSVDSGTIIPPTWAKGTHRKIAPVWKKAFEVLQASNQIRFIGYSLPVADSYVKYLLKTSAIRASNLKQIDVICLDANGEVERRYREFIGFNFLRFKSAPTQDYLTSLLQESKERRRIVDRRAYKIDGLERIHAQFMDC